MTTRLPLLAALLFLAAPAAAKANPPAGMQAPSGLRSEVPALRLAPLQRLPRAPGPISTEFCRHLMEAPRTPAGREVAAAGWTVTREATLGPYQVVAFVGRVEVGTSGSCRLGDGNLGIFRGGALVAIAYAPAGGGAAIGGVRPFRADMLRVWNGDYLSQPVADLRLGPDESLTLQPLASEEWACGGKAVVPNIYGLPIDRARTLLQRSGWTPAPPASREGHDSRVADLVRRGVPEVEDCSGTGFGFCGYGYRAPAATLSVTTAGDNDFPTVSGYGVTCSPG